MPRLSAFWPLFPPLLAILRFWHFFVQHKKCLVDRVAYFGKFGGAPGSILGPFWALKL